MLTKDVRTRCTWSGREIWHSASNPPLSVFCKSQLLYVEQAYFRTLSFI